MKEMFKLSDPTEDFYLIYKHSITCPVSAHAIQELTALEKKHKIPIYKVVVQASPDLKFEVARHFGIAHESPQLIIVKDGKAVTSLVHYDINVQEIEEHL